MKLVRRLSIVSLIAAVALSTESLPAAPEPQRPVPPNLDLKDAIGFAVDNNFAIRQARERIRQQEGVVIEVSARQIPNVAATGGYQQNDKTLSQSFPASDRSWQIGLTVSQTLYAGGGVSSSIKS